jgi:hypothetical protein
LRRKRNDMKNTVIKFNEAPRNSAILDGFANADYCDSYRITRPTHKSIEQITNEIFRLPNWVVFLMKIRDSVAGKFGLKTEKDADESKGAPFFPLISRNENEIVMGENDKHLNFRTSVLVDRENSFVYLTTALRYNAFLGKAYFLPVKPFHKIIVKSLMKNLSI